MCGTPVQPILDHKNLTGQGVKNTGNELKSIRGSWGRRFRVVEAPKKGLVQAPFKAPIHSKCCIGGYRKRDLALVIVLRCD